MDEEEDLQDSVSESEEEVFNFADISNDDSDTDGGSDKDGDEGDEVAREVAKGHMIGFKKQKVVQVRNGTVVKEKPQWVP